MFASLVVLVGAARSLPPISNSSNLCFCAVAAAVAVAQDAAPFTDTIDAAILCSEKFNKGTFECLTTNNTCPTNAADGAAKTCTCFLATFRCLAELTPCTTDTPASNTFSDELKVGNCVKYSRCTEAQCKALVIDTPIDDDTNLAIVVVAPIVISGLLICALFGIAVVVVVRQRQRAKKAQAVDTQVAVIAGLGVVGKPSAPALTPEPEFLQELEVLSKK